MLTSLDAVGSSTKRSPSGITIATAVLAATALFGAFRDAVTTAAGGALSELSALEAPQYLGILDVSTPQPGGSADRCGRGVPVLGLAINAVARAAGAIIFEVRRQFRERPGSWRDRSQEYGRWWTSARATHCVS